MSDVSLLLSDSVIFELTIRLILGAVASFLSIISWTRTRHLYWFFVIAGILSSYAGTLYRALRAFGLFTGPEILVFSAPLGIIISDNLSVVCGILAVVFYLRSNK